MEVPCQKRNAAGAAVALVSAEIALAGIGNLVDFDQTVDAMFAVGKSLPFELRESALGASPPPRRLRLLRKLHEQELEGIPPNVRFGIAPSDSLS